MNIEKICFGVSVLVEVGIDTVGVGVLVGTADGVTSRPATEEQDAKKNSRRKVTGSIRLIATR